MKLRTLLALAAVLAAGLATISAQTDLPLAKAESVGMSSKAIYRPDKDGKITLFRKPEFHEPTTYFPGVAGLNGTAADYFRFSQMLLNGGEYNGQRLLGRMTVNTMITNQIGSGKPIYIRGDGYGFGLGFCVLLNPAKSVDALSIGTFSWGGANGTLFWIDPQEDLIGIMMIQINPYSHFSIRPCSRWRCRRRSPTASRIRSRASWATTLLDRTRHDRTCDDDDGVHPGWLPDRENAGRGARRDRPLPIVVRYDRRRAADAGRRRHHALY